MSVGRAAAAARRLLAGGLLLALAAPAAAEWTLGADAWARPRSGSAVLSMEPLPAVVDAWSRDPGARIVICYAGGEEGEIWAAELRDWLIALGIPGHEVQAVGGGEPQELRLEVQATEGAS